MIAFYCLLALATLCGVAWLYWRHAWFFRNPPRRVPWKTDGILSPADGTVVYVKRVAPGEEVVTIKKGIKATIQDICGEEVFAPKLHIGIFMSPFDVHYNRAPIGGTIRRIRHYPADQKNLCMGLMHLRTIFRRLPLYRDSLHIIRNERTVTVIDGNHRGRPISCFIVQIAARSVDGIDSYFGEGRQLDAGRIFGMIRIGSQVDLIVTELDGMAIRVKPGDRVRAGETVVIE